MCWQIFILTKSTFSLDVVVMFLFANVREDLCSTDFCDFEV